MISPNDVEPQVGPYDFYLSAFKELGSCRNNSMSVGPIPFTAIVEYHKIYGYGVDDLEDFHWIIRNMDDTYLALEAESVNKKGVSTNASTVSSTTNKSSGRSIK